MPLNKSSYILGCVVALLSSCSSSNNPAVPDSESANTVTTDQAGSTTEEDSHQTTPIPAEANATNESAVSLDIKQTNMGVSGHAYKLDLNIENQLLLELDEKILKFELTGAKWVGDELPDECTIQNANSQVSSASNTILCSIDSTLTDNAQDVFQKSYPVALIPYQTNEVRILLDIVDSTGVSTGNAQQLTHHYFPDGNTELDSQDPVFEEISRLTSLVDGKIFRDLNTAYHSLDGCKDSGHIELTYPSDSFFSPSTSQYVDCTTSEVRLDGEVTNAFGRYGTGLVIKNAMMTIESDTFTELDGEVSYDENRENSPFVYTTQLIGQLVYRDLAGITTVFKGYFSNCQNDAPFPIYTVGYPNYIEHDGFESSFTAIDKLLGGNQIDVAINARHEDQGSIVIMSDNGARLLVTMTDGPFPSVFIDRVIGGVTDSWIVPWTDSYGFSC